MCETKKGCSIEINHLDKSFDDFLILKDINLNIKPGEFIAVVGRSGCGKSTLLRLIAGLERAGGGSLKVDGKEVKGIDSNIRFLFQEARLLPWKTLIKNVMIGTHDKNEATAAQALERVGLIDRKYAWPAVLSGGQKQRVSLARALAGKPRILLFDEPLGALDALTRLDMQELIEKLWQEQGFTAVLVTHDVAEAVRLADRVILMEDKNITMDLKITLPRPRLKDKDSNYFEQCILNRIMHRDPQNEEYETRRIEYNI